MDNTEKFAELAKECSNCGKCDLAVTRNNLVFGVGNCNSDIMFIGEGPGEREDIEGEPFVGKAGQLLDVMLQLIGLDRKDIYITNVVKCRPPQNRDPRPEECSACKDWLDRQIEIINPKIIVCLGRIAATRLISEDFKITRERGRWFYFDGRKYIATYHPSFLLRDETKRPEAFSDFREIRAELRRCREAENA